MDKVQKYNSFKTRIFLVR